MQSICGIDIALLNIDSQSAEPRISIAGFQDLCSYFIISKRNKPSLWLENTENSANSEEKSTRFLKY